MVVRGARAGHSCTYLESPTITYDLQPAFGLFRPDPRAVRSLRYMLRYHRTTHRRTPPARRLLRRM